MRGENKDARLACTWSGPMHFRLRPVQLQAGSIASRYGCENLWRPPSGQAQTWLNSTWLLIERLVQLKGEPLRGALWRCPDHLWLDQDYGLCCLADLDKSVSFA